MLSKVQLRLQFLVLLWGFTGLFGKLVTISALPMVWFRMSIAAFVIFIYLKLKKQQIKVSSKHLIQLLLIGGIVGLHWFTFYQSIKVSNVAIALSTLSLGALFTSIIEPILFKRKVVISEILLSLVVSGCVIWIFKASPEYKLGIIYGVICSFLSALFSVLNSTFKEQVKPANITFYEMIGGFLTINILMIVFQPDTFSEVINVGWANFMWLALLAIVFTAFAQIEFVNLYKYFSPYTILLNVNLEPIYGIILASIVFGESEKMTPVFYIATGIMILSIIVNGIIKNKFPQFNK
ncbi:DMT family transporter [Faecalibacter rhinopitheci]|uniref:EamA family transporter n=1 Tax=Faecalibacter rhinopitheci TaxID=2779678 RepID=A0A8J7FRJ8_9FLAO|nr:EamA family transporter [Faecalibacter rhinopitheci]MBF0597223.1 EamA family transporter [Faecalibacter rhinopitheci]